MVENASRFEVSPVFCRKGRTPLFCSALLPLLVLSMLWGCNKPEPGGAQTAEQPVNVVVTTVKTQDVPIVFEFIAQVESSREVNIQARVSGFLEKRVYTEGAVVQEGETLFLMDQKPFKAQLVQAEAALARQQAAYEVARRNLARVKPLAAADALSQKDLDDATGQYQSTAAAVEQAKATVEQARLDLSYTVITSPVTGITGSADQAEGTYLSFNNSQLTTVTVLSPIYVNFSVSENDWLRSRDQIAKGRLIQPEGEAYTAEIILADGSLYPHTGRLTFADPSFNPETGTFLIRATFDNPDGQLHPNQYVRIRLKGAIRPNAVLVPQRAVQQSSKGHFVWIQGKDDRAETRPVLVGEWHGDQWVISEGLHPGDRVIVDGMLALRPGALLKVNHPIDQEGTEKPAVDHNDPPESGR
ncbi:Efflux transporter, RND family, MFP subunit [uncultured Desulfatiglans sp.]|nr:Efflux transporter, RND family, MFP subunit [uncultured Desulfatiglans sp.]